MSSNSKKRIYLLRHGETNWNARGLIQGGGFDIDLNDNGKWQAQQVAEELERRLADNIEKEPVMLLASSHMQRAKQTASIVREHLSSKLPNLKIVPNRQLSLDNFGEMRFGELEGLAIRGSEVREESLQRYRVHADRIHGSLDEAWPGEGETMREVQDRGVAGLERLWKEFPNVDVIVIVAHGRFNKILLSSVLYGDALRCSEIQQGNTCINIIDCEEAEDGSLCYKEVQLNFVKHTEKIEK